MDKPTVIVTAGGTKEPIDDVRFITNFSTGRFGYEISRVLAEGDLDLNILCPKEVPLIASGMISNAKHIYFTNTESLQNALLGFKNAGIIFHSAAVSDFRPVQAVDGKISSSQEYLTIKLERTPKILAKLREHFGKSAFLVGFKLLSGVSRNELVKAAMIQNKNYHLNLTVANDLKEMAGDGHPVTLVTAEGGVIRLAGSRQEVARKLVTFVIKRASVNWFQTQQVHSDLAITDIKNFHVLLKFAQEAGLLTDNSGNVSMRFGESILVTPRQVDKSKVEANECCLATVDADKKLVISKGKSKSSIDTGVQELIYKKFPNIQYLLHFHNYWGDLFNQTQFPYPCGTVEEAEEILASLLRNENPTTQRFSIELVHHGALLGLDDQGIGDLKKDWLTFRFAYEGHLAEVHKEEILKEGRLKPIFFGVRIAGVVLEMQDGIAVYIADRYRGKGLGKTITKQIIDRQLTVKTIDDCGVRDFYSKQGFVVQKSEAGMYWLQPPPITGSDEIFNAAPF